MRCHARESLLAVLEWSCGLLLADRRTVLSRLSVFAGYFGVDDAIDVASDESVRDKRYWRSSLILLTSRYSSRTRAVRPFHIVCWKLLKPTPIKSSRRREKLTPFIAAMPNDFSGSANRSLRSILISALFARRWSMFRIALEWSLGRRGDICAGRSPW